MQGRWLNVTDKVRLFKLFKKFFNFLWLKLDSHADTGQLSRDYQIIYSLLYYTSILLIMSITVTTCKAMFSFMLTFLSRIPYRSSREYIIWRWFTTSEGESGCWCRFYNYTVIFQTWDFFPILAWLQRNRNHMSNYTWCSAYSGNKPNWIFFLDFYQSIFQGIFHFGPVHRKILPSFHYFLSVFHYYKWETFIMAKALLI